MRERNRREKTGDISNYESGETYNLQGLYYRGYIWHADQCFDVSKSIRLLACCLHHSYYIIIIIIN